jgi:hypothetical protein
MGDQPRRHHLVPRGLLAGFTLPRSPEQLWVIDTKRIKLFPANIKDITVDKDFYRITPDNESGDPFAVEKMLGEIESKALPIIRRIDESGRMPIGEDRKNLMMFLAVLKLRVRFFRSQLDGAISQMVQHMLDLSMATQDRWESSLAKVNGADVPKDHPDYETCKNILARGGLSIQVSHNMLIKSMLDAVDGLFLLLMRRHWVVHQTDKRDGPWFVCTDEPMTLSWLDPPKGFLPPGFGLRNTIITVPLTRSTVLQGWMPGDINGELSGARPADPLYVAFFNHRVISLAGDQIYSPTKDMLWLGANRRFMGTENFLDLFRANVDPGLCHSDPFASCLPGRTGRGC